MSTVPQQMVIGDQTMTLNPDQDTDFTYKLVMQQFTPLGATSSIVQTMGMASGERKINGTLKDDASYRQLQGTYRAMRPVACIDWLGNPFTALITDMSAESVMDVTTGFQTRRYAISLLKR